MTRDEFVEHVENGADIMFDAFGKHYTVLGWNENGPLIAEQVTEDNEAVFPDGRALLENYKIDGRRLTDVWDDVQITYCT